jgi:MoaA/NifB/PqqE/SkfB family radical SAM enzyme
VATRKPLNLWLELTEACQYKCRFCYNYWRDRPASGHVSMSGRTADEAIGFLEKCSSSYHSVVALAGGDPTAHPDFLGIALRAAAAADEVTVVTHGGDISAQQLIALSRLPNLTIQFSVPSLDIQRYRFLTGNGDLGRVMTAMLMCRELSIPVSLSVVVTDLNKDDLSGVVHLAAEIEAEYLIVNRFLASGRGVLYEEKFAISATAFDEAMAAAREVGRHRGVRLLGSGNHPDIRQLKASEPKLTISANGEIRLCSLVSQVAATLQADPVDIVEECTAFWKSKMPLEGCICASRV